MLHPYCNQKRPTRFGIHKWRHTVFLDPNFPNFPELRRKNAIITLISHPLHFLTRFPWTKTVAKLLIRKKHLLWITRSYCTDQVGMISATLPAQRPMPGVSPTRWRSGRACNGWKPLMETWPLLEVMHWMLEYQKIRKEDVFFGAVKVSRYNILMLIIALNICSEITEHFVLPTHDLLIFISKWTCSKVESFWLFLIFLFLYSVLLSFWTA